MPGPTTRIAHHTAQAIYVRGASLVDDLIGKLTFTEMMYFQLMGERPTPGQTKVLDAVLVTLMEHGITPSAIVSRLIYDSCPEGVQAAVAAGLLGVGSTFIGTMEGCAKNLEEILQAPEGEAARAQAIAQRVRAARQPIPGFGHPHHKPDDPRSPRLIEHVAPLVGGERVSVATPRRTNFMGNSGTLRSCRARASSERTAKAQAFGTCTARARSRATLHQLRWCA